MEKIELKPLHFPNTDESGDDIRGPALDELINGPTIDELAPDWPSALDLIGAPTDEELESAGDVLDWWIISPAPKAPAMMYEYKQTDERKEQESKEQAQQIISKARTEREKRDQVAADLMDEYGALFPNASPPENIKSQIIKILTSKQAKKIIDQLTNDEELAPHIVQDLIGYYFLDNIWAIYESSHKESKKSKSKAPAMATA